MRRERRLVMDTNTMVTRLLLPGGVACDVPGACVGR